MEDWELVDACAPASGDESAGSSRLSDSTVVATRASGLSPLPKAPHRDGSLRRRAAAEGPAAAGKRGPSPPAPPRSPNWRRLLASVLLGALAVCGLVLGCWVAAAQKRRAALATATA